MRISDWSSDVCSSDLRVGEQAEARDVAVGIGLDAGDQVGTSGAGKQMGEAFLRLEVLLHRYPAADFRHRRHLAAFGLEHREDAGLARQPCQLDRKSTRLNSSH